MTNGQLALNSISLIYPISGIIFTWILAFVLTYLGASIVSVIAFPRSKRASELPWPELAREYCYARILSPAAFPFFLLGTIFAYDYTIDGAYLPSWVHVFALIFFSYAGARLVHRRIERRVGIKNVSGLRALRRSLVNWSIFFPHLLWPLIAFVSSGKSLERGIIAFPLAALATATLFSPVGLWILKKVGILRNPTEALTRAVEEASKLSGIPVRGAYVANLAQANAFAWTQWKVVGVTDIALQRLSPAQLTAILLHELGHLNEARATTRTRYVFYFFPLIIFVAAWASLTFPSSMTRVFLAVVFFGFILAARLAKKKLQHAEEHSDSVAKTFESEYGEYAKGLEVLYRENLMPVVIKGGIHPSLYDRMEKAGVTPTYPRPLPPPAGRLLAGSFAAIVVCIGIYVGHVTPQKLAANYIYENETLIKSQLWNRHLRANNFGYLAAIYAINHQPAEAVLYYKAADELDPGYPPYLIQISVQLAALRICTEAKQYQDEANEEVRDNPSSMQFWVKHYGANPSDPFATENRYVNQVCPRIGE